MDFLGYGLSDIAISVTNWPVFVYCCSKLLKTIFSRLICVRGNFISAGLADIVLMTSVADCNEVRFACRYLYVVSIYPESYVIITLSVVAAVVLLAPDRSAANQFCTHSATDDILVWSSAFRAISPDFYLL